MVVFLINFLIQSTFVLSFLEVFPATNTSFLIMPDFVDRQSVVRKIWGKSDTILLIFAGAAAEFALNKAVDWLYFTGRLPADPLGRLFTTVAYARTIVFSEERVALQAINAMAHAHAQVEARRGEQIPKWAYRDVLFMLTDYSMRAFEALERPITLTEKREVFEVFNKLGKAMGLHGLPATLEEWQQMRTRQLEANLQLSAFTVDLFHQYRKHLGMVRYYVLREAQALIIPAYVRTLLGLHRYSLLRPLLGIYRWSKGWKADRLLKKLLFPPPYQRQIGALDV